MTKEEIISLLHLKPLPKEGGFYRETYRSQQHISCGIYSGHVFATAIYYFVTADEFSSLHRIKQDEVFHFYLGSPVRMIQIDEKGTFKTLILGHDLKNGQVPQEVVPGMVWQGIKLLNQHEHNENWALLGTTVAPGFEFDDFEAGSRESLVKMFPAHKDEIINYTR